MDNHPCDRLPGDVGTSDEVTRELERVFGEGATLFRSALSSPETRVIDTARRDAQQEVRVLRSQPIPGRDQADAQFVASWEGFLDHLESTDPKLAIDLRSRLRFVHSTTDWAEVDGDLTLADLTGVAIPKNLRVKGKLMIVRCVGLVFSEEGGLSTETVLLHHSRLTQLPDKMNIDGNFVAPDQNIHRWPRELTVEGDVLARGCHHFYVDSLNINGHLVLNDSINPQITSTSWVSGDVSARGVGNAGNARGLKLGAKLGIGGTLDIQDSVVSEFHNNSRILGDVFAQGAALIDYPEQWEVGGSIYLPEVEIRRLPGGWAVEGRIEAASAPRHFLRDIRRHNRGVDRR